MKTLRQSFIAVGAVLMFSGAAQAVPMKAEPLPIQAEVSKVSLSQAELQQNVSGAVEQQITLDMNVQVAQMMDQLKAQIAASAVEMGQQVVAELITHVQAQEE